jgi:hypothetical protein
VYFVYRFCPSFGGHYTYSNIDEIIEAMVDWVNFGEIIEIMDKYVSKNDLFGDPLNVSNRRWCINRKVGAICLIGAKSYATL